MFAIGIPRHKVLLLAVDVLSVVLALSVAYWLRVGSWDGGPLYILDHYTGATTIFVVSEVTFLYFFELYDTGLNFARSKNLLRIVGATGMALVVISVAFYALPPYRVARGIFAYGAAIIVLFVALSRIALNVLLPRAWAPRKVLVVGTGWGGEMAATVVSERKPARWEIVGFVDDAPEKSGTVIAGIPVAGVSRDLLDLCQQHKVRLIVLATTSDMNPTLVRSLMQCKSSGVEIQNMETFFKKETGRVPIRNINETWFLCSPGFDLVTNNLVKRSQRLFDLAVSFILLLSSLPVLGLCAVAIKLTSPGPVLLRQTRTGINERPFTLYKLRTMVRDAEHKSGPTWSQANDTRITTVGRFLRRTRLDEIPQLYNVLLGEMSFIGPRPERPFFTEQLKETIPFYPIRFSVKPGLTGWAQVNYRYGASEEDAFEKLQYDLFYVQEMSFTLNLVILLKTVQTVLLRPGS